MRLYWVTQKQIGDNILEVNLTPQIPKTVSDGEDKVTPRICMSSSVIGAINSISNNIYGNIVYVYTADVKVQDIIQPSIEQVPDVFMTGEMWVIKPIKVSYMCSLSVSDKHISLLDIDEENGMYYFDVVKLKIV